MMFFKKIKSWEKYIALFALAGLFISVVAGIIGRVTFLSMVMRAILFAVLFAGFFIGVMFLIERFIPELLADENSSNLKKADKNKSEEKGQKIDVTVGDIEADDDKRDDKDNISKEDEEIGVAENDRPNKEKQNLDTNDSNSNEQEVDEENVEEIDELELADEADTNDTNITGEMSKPEKYEESAFDMLNKEEKYGDIYDSADNVEILGEAHSTEELAKAVHTVLQKDQKG